MEDPNLSNLTGCIVEAVEARPGRSFAIKLSGGYALMAECLWRLLKGDQLVLTSEDDGQLFGRSVPVNAIAELSNALIAQSVSHTAFVAGAGDLLLQIGDFKLQLLSDSSGYEAWQLQDPEGLLLVAQGGNVAIGAGNA